MESPFDSSPNAIAIVGMAGRFPGAGDLEGFWANLVGGVESISFFSEQELRAAGVEPALLADPAYVRARSVLDGTGLFDAAFFDLSPREAEVLDPQHRLLLECAWEALENAGCDPRRYPGPIGVFAGAGFNTYLLSNVQHNPEVLGAIGAFQAMLGNGSDTLATRVSYKLGLRGPSLTVQTACSTSLVAVHLAVQSLLNSECDMALAGGVRLLVPREGGHMYQPGSIFSRDGHCRAFDAASTGTTDGEGCGIVVLKRLADAVADGDRIHAVILGSAINNDGSGKMAYTVPSIEGQSEVIAMAQALAGVDPGTIGMIEAHGTGTPLGDPIEVRALSRVFSTATEPGRPCALGSLKTNLGHMDAAAGVGSLIKATLAIERGVIPPSLHFERPNPQIDFASSPFYVPVQATPWPGDGPRRAGVSSFGIGGTNAHVVLEEAPEVPAGGPSRPLQLLVLSAPTLTALETITENLAGHLRRQPEADLADIAYTLQVGRAAFDHRRVVVCASVEDAAEVLSSLDPKRVLTRTREAGERSMFFLFPGQGSQHPGMGAELYRSEAVFRDEVDRCAGILQPLLGLDLRQVLYPEGGDPQEAAGRLQQTALAQPALFVIEHALARLWMSWGIQPQAMLGHSIGEYVAACLAGVFSLEDALRLVVERGRLMQEMPGGSMLAVPLPEAEVTSLLGGLSLAAVNGPAMCVVSGESEEIDDLAARLAERGVQARRLHTSHAFHSAALEPMLERFEAAFQGLSLGAPRIPFLSNLTGTWIRPEEARSPHYWVRHLREAVRFSEGLEALFAQPSSVLLEVGPGQALTALARQHPNRPAAPAVVPSLPSAGDGRAADAAILRALGQLWMAGVEIDWSGVHAEERRLRVPLPTYPFERQRYWVEPISPREQVRRRITANAQEIADWFWVPLWRQALAPDKHELPEGDWLVFADEAGLGDRLTERLREQAAKVTVVRAGHRFQEAGPDAFEIRPGAAADYGALFDRLAEPGSLPARIIHLWSVGPSEEDEQERSFFSLFHLARALGERRSSGEQPPLHLGILSTGVQRITGDDDLRPVRATLLGPATTLPQEYPGITCAAVDITLPSPGSRQERRLVDLLLAEMSAPGEPVVAYRGTDRWLPVFEPLHLESPPEPLPLRERGTYLVTGGLGGVGLELAGLLARLAKARLVLSGRTPFAERDAWPELARGVGRTAQVARRLLELEAAGAQVWIAAADVTDASSMARLFRETRDRFGRIDGVIHAAGLPGGGLLQWRSEEDAAAVLAPKVQGTLLLEELLAGDAPDFLVLCSSLNALIGGPGQSDYTAANAFLDAFAQSRAGEMPVLSINWAAWRNVGMAALLPGAEEVRDVEVTDLRPYAHPLLRERGTDGAGEAIFIGRLCPSETWVIDEHRLGGSPIVPGTAYLEMADAAFRGLEGADSAEGAEGAVEIRDVQFLRPLRIADGETREIHAVLHRNGNGFHRFSIRSREGDGWQEHVLGSVGPAAPGEQERLDLSFTGWEEDVVGDDYREDLKQAGFGPRWEALRKVYRRDGEVVGLLELAPELTADLDRFRLHPALLDVATGFAQAYVEGRTGYYLPLSYKRLQVKGPLPARIYSHARLRDTGLQSLETLSFDIAVLDETGLERLRIEEYTIKRVDVAASLRETAGRAPTPPGKALPFRQVEETLGSMEPEQAVEAFRRILGSGGLPQIAISVQPLPDVVERARALTAERLLETVNLTSSGHARPDLETPYVEPRGELEERLAAIWRDVLGLDRVGTADDFFELGGHSLLGTQLISRVRDAFGVEMPLGQLFETPTVGDFAPVIAAKLDLVDRSARQTIPRLARGGGLPLSFGQARLWFLHQWEPGGSGYNMSMALHGRGRFDVGVTAAVLSEIVRRHEVLRTTFRVAAGEPEQIISPRAAVPLPVIDLADLPAAARDLETERLAAEEARRPFDLGRGPLLRATVLRQAAEQHTVFLTVHHIVSDGWSTGVLVQEFGTLYTAFLAGRPSPLPALPIQYADFAAWQRRHLSGPLLEAELSWWREQLAGMPPVLDLPTDHPRSADNANRAAVHEFEIGREDLAGLTGLVRSHGATLFMALLTGFSALLARYTGQEDLAVGTPIAGRIHVETEPLIGLFVNSLVLRMRLAGDPELAEILERTRETTLAAYAHQEMPFERLVDEVAPERSLDRPPLVQVMLVLQNAPASALELPGVAVTASEMAVGTAKFELSCTLMETGRGLHGVFEYSRDLFEAPTIARLAGHFLNLLRAATATPRARLSEARMLSAPELHQALYEWRREDGITLLDRWGAPVPIGIPGELSPGGDRARYLPDGSIEILRDRPEPETQETGPAGATSHTEVEELLAGIWAEVLETDSVGVRDNFFSLGGHSLLITQVLSRVRETFGVELAVRELFEAPTVGGFAFRIRQAMQSAARALLPPIERLPRDGDLPLSFAQARLWFLDQLDPDSSAYNLPVALRVRGPIDVAAMAAALGETVRRHEALRTTFVPIDGRPAQVIAAPAPAPLPQVDLRGLPETEALRRLQEEGRRPFDLARGPLLRTLLLRLADEEHLLLLNMHHIVSDGWSMGILVREIGALYSALRSGQPSPLPELPVQYVDFASWQRQWLQGAALETELSYWREQLAGVPAALELPTDRPRPAMQTFAGKILPVALPRELSTRLQALSRRTGATLFMTLLAVFQELLGRYSEQSDLTVGTPVAGRTHLQTEGLIGFFVNMLVVRTDLSGGPSFATLVGRLRETLLSAYAHQDLPFETLVEELQPERSLSRSPLYQVVLALQNTPSEALAAEELSFEPLAVDTGMAKFDLTLTVQQTDDGLAGVVEHNTDLFDDTTVLRLVRHWETLLAGVVAAPDLRLTELTLLSPEERVQLLQEWSGDATSRRVYVLDRDLAPVPIGVPGDLYVAGDAPEPGHPAERFLPDPFGSEPGGRLFRTGDRARWRPDGEIQILGLDEPAPADEPRETASVQELSNTPVEELLAGIWAEVLEADAVGVRDNFFSLGGHSLLITQMISRVRETFRVELAVRELFEAPTVAGFAFRIRQAMQSAARALLPPIEPIPRDGDLPLSFAQERLWFFEQFAPGGAAYNIPILLRVRGPLDVAALNAALDEETRRHEVLRTTFASADGRPAQRIGASEQVLPALIDLTDLPASRRWPEALDSARAESRRAFDLIHGPMLRCLLLRLEERDHLLLLNMHHIASDGWSMGVLVRELTVLYDSFLEGRPSPLAELPVQYVDFAAWQRQWLQGEALEAELSYWREHLKGVPAVLELPTDRPRPAAQTFDGATVIFSLPKDLSARLQVASRRLGATLFMVLLSAFRELLGRYSGQSDLTIGTPVAGRTHLQTENLIGFFVNMLVVRSNRPGPSSFSTLVGEVRETLLSAYAHQDVPFENLVEALQPERSLSHTPLFQVVLALQNTPFQTLEVKDLSFEMVPMETGTAKFDLTVSLQETGNGLVGAAEYNTALFDRTTVQRLIRHWEVLLDSASSAPERLLSESEWMTGEERAQVLRQWNDTARPFASKLLAHELFARHAALRPDATAVGSSEGRLTYGEVERRANRLAWHLRGLGVGPETLVAVCMERTLLRVVGIVAVLKAGGAFVSLDPTYPEERLAFMLEDARAPVVLTEARSAAHLSRPPQGTQVLCLDADWESIHGDESTAPDSGVGPQNLAFMVYTSGSTGRPKGVETSHTGLTNLVQWHQDLYGVRPEDRGTQTASPAFDASIWELWPYLAAGASVHIPIEEARLSPPTMIRWMTEQELTLAFLTTPLAEGILEVTPPHPGLRLRALISGGDRLHRTPHPEAGFRLMNHYGPAENGIVSTGTEVPPQARQTGLPPIGRPIDNTRSYILDSWLRPVPVGIPGELFVTGIGLARGYHERPDLTAAAFVPDPFSDEPGARMYRTADRVRWLPDGQIDFLGRLDHQVKLRGVRIELGEIESVLSRHPGLRDVAVIVREDRPGDRRLVAYVVASAEPCPKTEELRSFLAERLPQQMVPSAFVALDALPLTPNGKLDRKALPAPQGSRGDDGSYTAPSNPLEELLAGIWSEVLGIDRVGIHDSFFTLGGHSLLATQAISRIRGVLGVELPLRQLFESPTIAGLARVVQETAGTVPAPPILPIPPGLRDRDLPLSFAQQRLWLVDQIEPGSPAYNIPLALRLGGRVESGLLERIVSEIVRRHEALRTTFEPGADGPVQVIHPPAPIALPLLDLSLVPAEEREARACDLAVAEARRSFDLRRGPLLRLLLMRLAEEDHLLLLTVHHIVADGWSMDVLLREVAALHEAFSQDRPSPLSELPVQYADYAVWQRDWLRGEVLDAQLGYWKRRLASAPTLLELPLDRPRPAEQSYRGARHPVDLSGPLSEAVARLCRQHGVTPFMALLAAWAVLLGRHAGQDDVLVGAPIAGRNRSETEGLIGFFLNTLVLRTDLSGNPSLAGLLDQVRRTSLDAFANQDLPFERLLEDLALERSLAQAPLFQAMLVLQNTPGRPLTLPGLALSPVEVDPGLTKFDLSLTLSEGPRGFAGALTYAVDLFDPGTVDRLMTGFQTLLAAMSGADPDAPLHGLEILSQAERQQLLVDWSAAETGSSDLSLYGLFERQAGRTPDAIAVIFEDERWTYGDLLRRSREVAGFLRAHGVGPEDRVAILDQRSAERVARVLGVLAAGAAYVALDREQPPARRAELLADVAPVRLLPPQPPLPLTDGEMGAGVTLLPEIEPGAPEMSFQAPEDLGSAYVVYTSGSTGRPKGILAHHRGAATYLEWIVRNYGLSDSDVALQLAPLTFDASLRDTLAPLAAGARVVIVPDGVARDPVALLERMRENAVTCLPSIVPSLLRLLVEEALASGRSVPSVPTLRLMLASGEKLHGADAAAVRRAFGERVRLVNQYGASETTMTSSWYPVTADDESLPALPAGRPAASMRMFLLDSRLRPVPLGAVGEICFGGPGVTFGYLNQPDRTAEVFIPDPFGAPGERLYRTGDRGRYRPDGILELHGRIDFQLKIRGQRVEPGEVEAALRSHPAVRQAVVAALGEPEPRLTAWLVAEGVEAGDLRAFLAERLPAPMVPADWVFVDALPLTPHGKVDRSRLPEPSRERAAVQEPRDATELRLVRLWEEVLGLHPIGISDDFFSLGGHSLSAVRLVAGIRRHFGRDLPLSELFRRPTVERLAETLRSGIGDADLPWSPLVAMTPGTGTPLFCIHGGDGHALTLADLAKALSAAGEEGPVFALEARGLADGQTPLERIEDLADLYLPALREAWPNGPYRLLGYSMGGKVAFEIARRLELAGEVVEPVVLLDIPAFPSADANTDLEIPAEIRALPGFDPELAERYLAVWKAHLKASHSWTPAPYRGKVRLIVAEDGTRAHAPDPTLGWEAVAKGGVEVVLTPGDHFSMVQPPHVQPLARRVRNGAADAHLGRSSEDGSALVAL